METWRIAAIGLTTLIGGVLVVSAMTKVRDLRHRDGGDVVQTGVKGFSLLAVVDVLVATVFPATVSWAVVIAGAFIASVLMVTG